MLQFSSRAPEPPVPRCRLDRPGPLLRREGVSSGDDVNGSDIKDNGSEYSSPNVDTSDVSVLTVLARRPLASLCRGSHAGATPSRRLRR